jgi:outer membrane protein OmpA-like peptidoglycan-associated protein
MRSLSALLPWAVMLVACGQVQALDQRVEGVHRRLEIVLGSGAYYCAPRELALSRAHLEFARVELRHGDLRRSEQHVVEAELQAGAAGRLSPPERCATGGSQVPVSIPTADGPDADGDGIADRDDQCPAEAEDVDGHLDTDGCPELDNDGDGLPDSSDSCPNQPEDRDGFQDEDGCHDADNDGDGVDDAIDRCPDVPGTVSSQGCRRLKYKALEVTERDLRITSPILFDANSATIRSVSFEILDAVAQALADHDDIELEVQGHTDSQGDDRRNLELTQRQAEAVKAYLVRAGIAASRLTANGYGETRPIESNRTSQGRAINRRVEFVRTDSAP